MLLHPPSSSKMKCYSLFSLWATSTVSSQGIKANYIITIFLFFFEHNAKSDFRSEVATSCGQNKPSFQVQYCIPVVFSCKNSLWGDFFSTAVHKRKIFTCHKCLQVLLIHHQASSNPSSGSLLYSSLIKSAEMHPSSIHTNCRLKLSPVLNPSVSK